MAQETRAVSGDPTLRRAYEDGRRTVSYIMDLNRDDPWIFTDKVGIRRDLDAILERYRVFGDPTVFNVYLSGIESATRH